MPGLDGERPKPIVGSTTTPDNPMFKVDIAHIRDQFQKLYPKDHSEYDNLEGRKLITEALILTEQLLKENKTEGDASATINQATVELRDKTDRRVTTEAERADDEALLTLVDLIIEQTPAKHLLDLTTNKVVPATADFIGILTEAYKILEVKPISIDQLPDLIRKCARQQLLTLIGSDYLDKLAEFERKRAGAPQAIAKLVEETKPPGPTPPT